MEFAITVAIVLGILGWLAFSPDKFAEVIRVRAFGVKSKVERLLDSAKDRALKAKREAESKKAMANTNLIEIKKMRKRTEIDLNEAKAELARLDTAAENAASVGRLDLVTAAEERMEPWNSKVSEFQPQYDMLVAKENEVVDALADLDKIIAQRARQVNEIEARARTAKTTGEVNRLIASLNIDGSDDDMVKAFDLVKDAEAEAGVWKEEADKVRAANKQRAELDAMTNGPVKSAEQRAEERMAKYSHLTATE